MNEFVDISQSIQPLRWLDYLLVGAFSLILFGYCAFSGRPLTMHEARLPQTSREMKQAGEWLLPHSGIRPWLERPPLPHWIVIGSMDLFGSDQSVWVVRLPSAAMGTLTVLLTMWMAGKWFGRTLGQLSGLLLATSIEFYQYSGSAEDDIYLAALVAVCMALLAYVEFFSMPLERRWRFFNGRPPELLAFFFVLGLTNLTKGPLLGILMVGSPLTAYLLWNARWRPILRYVWLWGWIVLALVSIAWPFWALHRYPDVLANWKYDYLGRLSGDYSDINQPWFYYAPTLVVAMLPWTPACLIGLSATAGAAFRRASAPLRFVWCWAIAPLIVLSIPHGKHHHYLMPILAPWAILAAFGLVEIGRWLRAGRATLAIVIGFLLVGYSLGSTFLATRTDHTVDDTAFLRRVAGESDKDIPLFINAKLGNTGNLDFFRIQFYSRPDAILLHNLSYLRDENIKAARVYVITRARDEAKLRQLGTVAVVDQSLKSHEIPGPEGRFTLFELRFDPNLVRYPAPTNITNLQAMERDKNGGPWCGPPL
jgi:4-amino-4-deoxy-L-arabinose transferase-like glycosyltransferase